MVNRMNFFSSNDELIMNQGNVKEISKKLANKSILVTGATGLVGRSLVELLFLINKLYGYNVKIFAGYRNEIKAREIFNPLLKDSLFNLFFHDNLIPINSNERFDYIVHCASNADPSSYVNRPIETLVDNIQGTLNILYFSESIDVKKIVYVSSSEVYGESANSSFKKEDEYYGFNILDQRSNYPISKIFNENLCSQFVSLKKMNISIARPGHIFGPQASVDDSRATAQFTRMALYEDAITMKSEGLQRRSYVYSFDCATALIFILTSGESGQAYNIAYPNQSVSVKEMAQTFSDVVDKPLIINLADEKEKKGYTKILDSSLDSSKLTKLGWIAAFTPFTAVNETIKQLKTRQ